MVLHERELDRRAASSLSDSLSVEGRATSSPIPLPGVPSATTYPLPEETPPAPTFALPNPRLCAISARAAATVTIPASQGASATEYVVTLAESMLRSGWKHVGIPGLALAFDERVFELVKPEGGWTRRAAKSWYDESNATLEAHQTWARSRIFGTTLVVDGACISDAPFTGTQVLVVEIVRALAATRPEARIALAVPERGRGRATELLQGTGVEIIDRTHRVDCDVLYRPYQMLFADELDFVLGTGRRALVGQLDMIGYSIPQYHPADKLWFFARNMQRFLMRSLDGVTFISEHGRTEAIAECPDLDHRRTHVVYCGADTVPRPGALGPSNTALEASQFIACLASTFAHKNRAHAIATFGELCQSHGYDGRLVLVGPEPYYGRSAAAEEAAIAELPPDARGRVLRLGHVDDDEKWWLLRHAAVVLYPSIVEGFGLVPFEAAAVGTVCLSHHSTAAFELLGDTGSTVDSWAAEVWAERAAYLLANEDERQRVLNRVEAVAGRHTWEHAALRTWRAVDRALAAPRRQPIDQDGWLSAVSWDRRRAAPLASFRFNLARSVPALRRRLRGRLPTWRPPT